MKNRFFILLALMVSLAACETENSSEEIDGASIRALVLDMDRNPVFGAEVLLVDTEKLDVTDPSTYGSLKITDKSGVVVYPVETGKFAVTAYKELVGGASMFVDVTSLEETNIELLLMPEDFVNYPPQIQKITPEASHVTISSLEEVNLSFNLTDDHSDYSKLNVTVECAIDGLIFDGNPNSAGLVEVHRSHLSKGDHNLTLTAIDEHNAESSTSFLIDVSIVVPVELSAEKIERKSHLTWTEVLEPDFGELVIERYDPGASNPGFEVIATITDKTVTGYIDSLPPIAQYLEYRVRVHDTEARRSEGNIVRIDLPMGPFFYFGYEAITHTVLHPEKDWIYFNINASPNKIIIYDYANEKVIKEIVLNYEPRYPVIADNGNGLQVYVPGDNNAINIYTADENFVPVKTINTLEDVNNVVPNGNGILTAGMDNYYYDYRNYHLRTFSEETGAVLDSVGDRYGKARIVGDPFNKNIVYGFEKSSSNYARLKSEIDNNGKFISYKLENTYDYRISSRTLYAIPTGEHFVIDYGVYKTSDLSSGIDLGSQINNGITYNDLNSQIYTCNRTNNRIYVWSDSFTPVNEIETRFTPGKLNYRNNQLIVLFYDSGKYIVEVMDVTN